MISRTSSREEQCVSRSRTTRQHQARACRRSTPLAKRGGKKRARGDAARRGLCGLCSTASTHDYILFLANRGRCYLERATSSPGRAHRAVNIVIHSGGQGRKGQRHTACRWTTIRSSSLPRVTAPSAHAAHLHPYEPHARRGHHQRRTDGSQNISNPQRSGHLLCRDGRAPHGPQAVGVRHPPQDGDWVVGAEIAQPDAEACCPLPKTVMKASVPRPPIISAATRNRNTAAVPAWHFNITDKTGPVRPSGRTLIPTTCSSSPDDGVIIHGGRRHLRARPRDAGRAHHARCPRRARHPSLTDRAERRGRRHCQGPEAWSTIYTDGACSGKPRRLGHLEYGAHEKELSGGGGRP